MKLSVSFNLLEILNICFIKLIEFVIDMFNTIYFPRAYWQFLYVLREFIGIR